MNEQANIKNEIKLNTARLNLYRKAEAAILRSQSYEIEGLRLTRADLKSVQSMITALESKIAVLYSRLNSRKKFRVVRPGW